MITRHLKHLNFCLATLPQTESVNYLAVTFAVERREGPLGSNFREDEGCSVQLYSSVETVR